MTTSLASDRPQVSASWSQRGFLMISVLFNLYLIAQVLTVGAAYFHNSEWWNVHILLVRGYSGLSLLLLGWVFLSPFPFSSTEPNNQYARAARTTIFNHSSEGAVSVSGVSSLNWIHSVLSLYHPRSSCSAFDVGESTEPRAVSTDQAMQMRGVSSYCSGDRP